MWTKIKFQIPKDKFDQQCFKNQNEKEELKDPIQQTNKFTFMHSPLIKFVFYHQNKVSNCLVLCESLLLLVLSSKFTFSWFASGAAEEPLLLHKNKKANPYVYTPLSQMCKIQPPVNHWRRDQVGAFESPRYKWRKLGVQASACAPTNDIDKEAGLLQTICLL